MNVRKLIGRTKPWDAYPIGTKAYSYNGGYWIRVANGWEWRGDIFPTPGSDAIGKCIALPTIKAK